MLGGLSPVLIFNFFKATPVTGETPIPIVGNFSLTTLPPIPVYLDEKLTGIFIESETKNIDIDTAIDAKPKKDPYTELKESVNKKSVETNQKPINSVTSINMIASSDSIGMVIISSMMDLIYPMVTAKEYSITYLHGAVTIFNGLLHSFSIEQNSNDTIYKVRLELVRTTGDTRATEVAEADTKLPQVPNNNRGPLPDWQVA